MPCPPCSSSGQRTAASGNAATRSGALAPTSPTSNPRAPAARAPLQESGARYRGHRLRLPTPARVHAETRAASRRDPCRMTYGGFVTIRSNGRARQAVEYVCTHGARHDRRRRCSAMLRRASTSAASSMSDNTTSAFGNACAHAMPIHPEPVHRSRIRSGETSQPRRELRVDEFGNRRTRYQHAGLDQIAAPRKPCLTDEIRHRYPVHDPPLEQSHEFAAFGSRSDAPPIRTRAFPLRCRDGRTELPPLRPTHCRCRGRNRHPPATTVVVIHRRKSATVVNSAVSFNAGSIVVARAVRPAANSVALHTRQDRAS